MNKTTSSLRFQPLRSLIESRRWLVILAVAGTLLRFALIVQTLHNGRFYDEIDYDHIGVSVLQGHGFMDHTIGISEPDSYTAFRAPAQPVLIALVYRVTGRQPVFVEVFQALLLAALPFLCSGIGRILGLSPLAANIGATLAAFHPVLDYASSTLYPTTLTTVALTFGIWACWESIQRNRASWAIGAGIALGIAGAATTTFAPIPFLAAVIVAFRRRMKLAILIALFGLAPVLTWMVRNKLVLHDFTVATNGGYNLKLGANDDATPRSGNWITLYPPWELGEIKADQLLRDQAMAWIHAHPARYAELTVLRALAVFDSVGKPRTQGLNSGRLAQIAGWALLPVVLLGVAGLILRWRHPVAWLTAAALGLVILSSALTLAKPRFRLPIDPLLCVFAMSTVASIRRPQAGTK
ncbi:MAG: hypothetical protein WAK33_11280 [Silvibacterium sp.]